MATDQPMLRAIALTIFLAAAAGVAYVAYTLRTDRTPQTGMVAIRLGGRTLTVDRSMVRDPALRAGGAANRLDLILTWPDFRGGAGLPASSGADLVFMALEAPPPRKPAATEIDAVGEPVQLYSRFLDRDAWQNPGGLIMRRFRTGTPYDGEELYVSSPDERVFAARCPRYSQQDGLPEDLCLWQTRQNGFDIQVRFLPRYLVEWPNLAAGVRSLTTHFAAATK